MTVFDDALKLTLGFEGGVSNDPIDRGGLTNHGVTQAAYNRWRRRQGLPVRPVTEIEQGEVRRLYEDDYWLEAHCDELPDLLAKCQFDAAVNSGSARAIKFLQQALGLGVDGIYADNIRLAVLEQPEAQIVEDYLNARDDFYDDIVANDPSQARFIRGWHNRITKLRAALLEHADG